MTLALIAAVISEVSAPPLLLLQPGAWGGGGFGEDTGG